MSTNNQLFLQTSSGKQIFVNTWEPEKDPKAVIVLVHGLGEHSGRYAHVAEFFNQNDVALFALDLAGHGKTNGILGHVDSYDEFSIEVDRLIDYAREMHPDAPLFLYGHSMGGSVVLNHTLKNEPAIKGQIVTSPGLSPGTSASGVKIFAVNILASLLPKMTMDNGLDLQNLSRDQEVIDKYVNDPLVHSKISFRLVKELINNGQWAVDHASNLKFPTLLLQGGTDHLVSPESTRLFANKAPDNLLDFTYYPDHYHELHNEPDKEQILNTILDWVEKHIHS